MRTCKTCKHWTNVYSLPDEDEGECARFPDFEHVSVESEYGWGGYRVITREDFGCILHEEADDD